MRRPLRGIRRASQQPATGAWTLVTDGVRAVEGTEADVNDQGQYMLPGHDGYRAWRAATFTRDGQPRRQPSPYIIVWTYVVAFQGHFEVAVHYHWDITRGCGHPTVWEYDGWICGLDIQPYSTFRDAFGAAHAEAQYLAQGTPAAQAEYPEIFDWDGVAFGRVPDRKR
jgi:hypothetical protein